MLAIAVRFLHWSDAWLRYCVVGAAGVAAAAKVLSKNIGHQRQRDEPPLTQLIGYTSCLPTSETTLTLEVSLLNAVV
jgi:hypothetical protein